MQTDREDKLENTEISKSKKKLPKQTLSEQQKKKLLEMEKAIQEHQQSGKAFVVAAALRCISEEKLYNMYMNQSCKIPHSQFQKIFHTYAHCTNTHPQSGD
ncbi:hypothetical protein HDV04_003606 [Boothiomyces sp. JEL0838]|nr:hypothetical protein HDV04_003606 [Boothiomyces sp. JEL0838]